MSRWKKDNAGKSAIYMRKYNEDPIRGAERRAKAAASAKAWRARNPERSKTMRNDAQKKKRYDVMSHYCRGNPRCMCCEITEIIFLQFDHIDDSGADWRRGVKKKLGYVPNGVNFPYWLEKNGYPKNIQVLCANCNWGRRLNSGICPHKISLTPSATKP